MVGRTLLNYRIAAKLASSLDHPNICTIYGLHEMDGLHFIAMQYIEGKNVRQLVNGRPLSLESALSIAYQVADALTAAHSKGIIHRDIKAGNVMVTASGLAKVLDFGLAKLLDENKKGSDVHLTEMGVPYGTATYAAPEQAAGKKVDHRADIFSTGVLLYEMLAGIWPFKGQTTVEVRYAVLHDTPEPIGEVRRDDPPPAGHGRRLRPHVPALVAEPHGRGGAAHFAPAPLAPNVGAAHARTGPRGAARQPVRDGEVDRHPPLPEPLERRGRGLLRVLTRRRGHHGAGAQPLAHRAPLLDDREVPGQDRRPPAGRAGFERERRARRRFPARGRGAAGQRAVGRRGLGRDDLERPHRRQRRRHHRPARHHRAAHRPGVERRAVALAGAAVAARDAQRRRLRGVPARTGLLRQVPLPHARRRRLRPRGRTLPARDTPRPLVRARAQRPRRVLRQPRAQRFG